MSVRGSLIRYNGATYRLDPGTIAELLAKGIIAPSTELDGEYVLAAEATFDPCAVPVVHRTGAEARDERADAGKRRMLAWLFRHRDGQGGAR